VRQDLLASLQRRGLRTDRSLLVILDGSKALRKAVRAIFGEAALVQRSQVHKTRHPRVLERSRSPVGPSDPPPRVSGHRDEDRAAAAVDPARRLEGEYPYAAESVREGLDDTLTVLALTLSPRLRRSLATTNAVVESLISRRGS
jgi:putative transposase